MRKFILEMVEAFARGYRIHTICITPQDKVIVDFGEDRVMPRCHEANVRKQLAQFFNVPVLITPHINLTVVKP